MLASPIDSNVSEKSKVKEFTGIGTLIRVSLVHFPAHCDRISAYPVDLSEPIKIRNGEVGRRGWFKAA